MRSQIRIQDATRKRIFGFTKLNQISIETDHDFHHITLYSHISRSEMDMTSSKEWKGGERTSNSRNHTSRNQKDWNENARCQERRGFYIRWMICSTISCGI